MRAICINLDRSTDRWRALERQAGAIGLAVERHPAIDGATLADPAGFPVSATVSATVSASATGCFLSHRAVWQRASKGEDDYVLVLEDDVIFSPELPRYLTDNSWIPRDADIVHIGGMDKRCYVQGRGLQARDRQLFRLIRCTGSEGYIISRPCAERLTRDFVSIDREFDQILFKGGRPDLKIYKLLPALCTQDRRTFERLIERPQDDGRRPKDLGRRLSHALSRLLGWLQMKRRKPVHFR